MDGSLGYQNILPGVQSTRCFAQVANILRLPNAAIGLYPAATGITAANRCSYNKCCSHLFFVWKTRPHAVIPAGGLHAVRGHLLWKSAWGSSPTLYPAYRFPVGDADMKHIRSGASGRHLKRPDRSAQQAIQGVVQDKIFSSLAANSPISDYVFSSALSPSFRSERPMPARVAAFSLRQQN